MTTSQSSIPNVRPGALSGLDHEPLTGAPTTDHDGEVTGLAMPEADDLRDTQYEAFEAGYRAGAAGDEYVNPYGVDHDESGSDLGQGPVDGDVVLVPDEVIAAEPIDRLSWVTDAPDSGEQALRAQALYEHEVSKPLGEQDTDLLEALVPVGEADERDARRVARDGTVPEDVGGQHSVGDPTAPPSPPTAPPPSA